MISLQLWQALMTPFVSHPLYWRRATWMAPKPSDMWIMRRWRQLKVLMDAHLKTTFILCVVGVIATTVIFGPGPLLVLSFGLPIIVMFLAIPTVLILSGTFYGVLCVVIVSDSAANERMQGRFLLMGLTSKGFIGALWAICSLEFHTSETLVQARQTIHRVFSTIAALLLLPLLFAVFVFIGSPSSFTNSAYGSIGLVSIGLLFPLTDYFQSTIIGCLIGMLAAGISKLRGNVRALAIGMFVAFQFAAYLIAAFLCLLIIPALFHSLQLDLNFVYLIVCLAIFYIVRELFILLLWLILSLQLDTHLFEMYDITRITPIPVRFLKKFLTSSQWAVHS